MRMNGTRRHLSPVRDGWSGDEMLSERLALRTSTSLCVGLPCHPRTGINTVRDIDGPPPLLGPAIRTVCGEEVCIVIC